MIRNRDRNRSTMINNNTNSRVTNSTNNKNIITNRFVHEQFLFAKLIVFLGTPSTRRTSPTGISRTRRISRTTCRTRRISGENIDTNMFGDNKNILGTSWTSSIWPNTIRTTWIPRTTKWWRTGWISNRTYRTSGTTPPGTSTCSWRTCSRRSRTRARCSSTRTRTTAVSVIPSQGVSRPKSLITWSDFVSGMPPLYPLIYLVCVTKIVTWLIWYESYRVTCSVFCHSSLRSIALILYCYKFVQKNIIIIILQNFLPIDHTLFSVYIFSLVLYAAYLFAGQKWYILCDFREK